MEVNRLINYLDANDNAVMKHLVNSFLIRNEDDLDILKDAECPPGTQAYLADESKVWELDANYEWQLKGGNGDENNSNTDDIIIVKAPLDIEAEKYYCDKTWREIATALDAKIPVMIIRFTNNYIDQQYNDYWIHSVTKAELGDAYGNPGRFVIYTNGFGDNIWTTEDLDGYPALSY